MEAATWVQPGRVALRCFNGHVRLRSPRTCRVAAEHLRLSDSSPSGPADLTFVAAAPSYQTSIPTTTKSFPANNSPPSALTPLLLLLPAPTPQNFLHLVDAPVLKAKLQGHSIWPPTSQTGLTALLGVFMPLESQARALAQSPSAASLREALAPQTPRGLCGLHHSLG